MAELRWGAATDEGQLRAQNEDHHFAGDGLFVVADGMGGHLAGEVASEMAVARLRDRLPASGGNTRDALVSAINEANRDIYRGSLDDPDQAGMGTTITAIAVVADPHDGEVLAIANVGDSRGYVYRHGRLRQVTIDHNFVQELVAEGAISREEARTHPRRNIVTRALGIEPHVRVDSWTMPVIRGDRFLLCSDGLVDEVPDDEIGSILAAHADDPGAAARALVDAANAAGGRDNITVVVVDVLAGDDPPDPTEELDVVPLWSDEADGEETGETEIVADPLDDELPARVPAATAALYDGADDAPPTGDEADAASAGATATPARRGRFVRFLLAVGVAAVLVLGFAVLAAWARSGYFVSFDDDGRVAIFQGRADSVLWFDPTVEAHGRYSRDELDDASVALVELRPEFESRASAELFVAERLSATTTTTTTTTTTPTTTTTTTPTTTTTTVPADPAATPGGVPATGTTGPPAPPPAG